MKPLVGQYGPESLLRPVVADKAEHADCHGVPVEEPPIRSEVLRFSLTVEADREGAAIKLPETQGVYEVSKIKQTAWGGQPYYLLAEKFMLAAGGSSASGLKVIRGPFVDFFGIGLLLALDVCVCVCVIVCVVVVIF